MAGERVTVFYGPYGSGKTEVAVNYAVWLAGRAAGVWLADLDLVTPYFRVRDLRDRVGRQGVRVVAPEGPPGEGDLPVLPPGLSGLLRGDGPGVIDVGGGDTGARVLGSLHTLAGDCRLWLVFNPYRPGCDSPAGLVDMARRISASSRLGPAGVVSNPHLGPATTVPVVARGHAVVEQAAARLGLPVVLLTALQDIAPAVEKMVGREVFPLERYLTLPWE